MGHEKHCMADLIVDSTMDHIYSKTKYLQKDGGGGEAPKGDFLFQYRDKMNNSRRSFVFLDNYLFARHIKPVFILYKASVLKS